MIIQFLLGLSIIVGLHELGHLLFAKLFGMRVESYSIGFSPKLFRFKWAGTEYSLGAIPLGGAVKIAGMLDESFDTKGLANKPQSWEFRAKPAWQRLVVIGGGILFNAVTGIVIYATMAFALGNVFLSKSEVNKHGVVPGILGVELGFQEGDQVIYINGKDFDEFADILKPHTLMAEGSHYTVLRTGKPIRIDIPRDMVARLSDLKQEGSFLAPRIPFVVGMVQQQGGAAQAGLQPGDRLIKVAGQATIYFHQLTKVLEEAAGQRVPICYVRSGTQQATTAQVSETGKLGFQPSLLLTYEQKSYDVRQAIMVGVVSVYDVAKTHVVALRKIVTGQLSPAKVLSGPIGIAQVFGKRFDWVRFWKVTALLSVALAFTNLLPIPALDGGHAVWLIYEILTGRKLSDRFLTNAQIIGMGILFLLIGYAIINDVYRLF